MCILRGQKVQGCQCVIYNANQDLCNNSKEPWVNTITILADSNDKRVPEAGHAFDDNGWRFVVLPVPNVYVQDHPLYDHFPPIQCPDRRFVFEPYARERGLSQAEKKPCPYHKGYLPDHPRTTSGTEEAAAAQDGKQKADVHGEGVVKKGSNVAADNNLFDIAKAIVAGNIRGREVKLRGDL